MTASEWSAAGDHNDRMARLYEQARALPRQARNVYLEDACKGDAELLRELQSLLEHGEAAEQFFDRLSDVATSAALTPSLTIGQYEILGCVGVGGMGAVYRARDTRLERDVALKFLPVHVRADPAAREQLLTEARTAAALEHVNVCTVHEIGESDDGRPFITMAFYAGETLTERLRRGPLPTQEAVDIAKQIARGLAAAHARAIVHRDVKPGNVMLTPDGTVKLLDFGLAKVVDSDAARSEFTPGTVAYMSPEQIRGDAVTPASDLWSLGVVIYEMLTGVQPFRGETHSDVRHAILQTSAAPIAIWADDTAPLLQRVVARLLEREPDARYGSATDVLSDLDLAVRPTRGRLTWVWRRVADNPRGGLLAALLIITVAVASWMRVREPSAAARAAPIPSAAAAAQSDAALPKGGIAIAVLPFTNATGDSAQAYLSDGLTEGLVSALVRVRTLHVVAHGSAPTARTPDARELGKALHVSTVLEGSVQKFGDRIRVNAQLIDAGDGSRIWSEMLDRPFGDIPAIQNDLALRIASALVADLTIADREQLDHKPTRNAEAFTLYLKGRHFWRQRTPASYERATQHFKRAIEMDPRYAAPHVGLAVVYSQQGMAGILRPHDAQRLTRASVLRALELDDSLAEAHTMLGVYLHVHDGDAEAADREHLRAIALEPWNAMARHVYGNFLRSLGRLDEAIVQQSLAVALDPLAPAYNETLATTLLRAGRLSEAYERLQDAIEIDSTYWRARAMLAQYYERTGRPNEALREFQRANVLAGGTRHRTQADIARVLARTGRQAQARRLVAQARAEAGRTGYTDPALATALFALGDVEGAHAWLEMLLRKRHPDLPFLAGDSRFAPFFDDARFIDLMRRAGVRYERAANARLTVARAPT